MHGTKGAKMLHLNKETFPFVMLHHNTIPITNSVVPLSLARATPKPQNLSETTPPVALTGAQREKEREQWSVLID